MDKQFLDYTGTNNKAANILLTNIMSKEEQRCLEEAFFGDNGWYRTINGCGMIKLKLAAMSLGVTNNIFTFDEEREKNILYFIQTEKFSEQQQLLMMRCYIKQKIVTYITLRNYLQNVKHTDKMTIKLYRGINAPYLNQKYTFSGMESWTRNINVAYKFAGDGGFVLEKEYPIDQIFAGMRSTFKNKRYRTFEHNGFYVRREREMIVENYMEELDCSNGNGVLLAENREIY